MYVLVLLEGISLPYSSVEVITFLINVCRHRQKHLQKVLRDVLLKWRKKKKKASGYLALKKNEITNV